MTLKKRIRVYIIVATASFVYLATNFLFSKDKLYNIMKGHEYHFSDIFQEKNQDTKLSPNDSNINNSNNIKYVLYWTKFWGHDDFLGKADEPFKGCPESRCKFTNDTDNVNVSHALIMNLRELNVLPHYRPPWQLYVCFVYEPPTNTAVQVKKYRHSFNLRWSYQSDADFHTPIGKIETMSRNEKLEALKSLPANFATGKTQLVTWVASRCVSWSEREKVVQELQKHIPVHVYGKCGNKRLCRYRDNNCKNGQSFSNIYKSYKFYLAFENAFCKDYITEKVWRAMKMKHAVPVVLGGGNYASDLPPHSFIDVHDFKSIKDLAFYLQMLDQDDELYDEYFEWKNNYKVVYRYSHQQSLCDLCSHLHQDEDKVKVIDLVKLFGINYACGNKTTLYKGIEDLH